VELAVSVTEASYELKQNNPWRKFGYVLKIIIALSKPD
jgi:hypothetical protein